MLPLPPIVLDDASIAESAQRLEEQVEAMQDHLNSYRPTMSLGSDGRLMCVMAQDAANPSVQPYPKAYAKSLFQTPGHVADRLAQVHARAHELDSQLASYTVQTLPSSSGSSLQAHAIPVGFLPVRGCDANWDGRKWQVVAGKIANAGEAHQDFAIEGQTFDGKTGVLYLRYHVRYLTDFPGSVSGAVSILGVELAFSAPSAMPQTTDIVYNPASEQWTDGYIISPLSYLLAPEGDRKAPRVVSIVGGTLTGAYPDRHSFSAPSSQGGISAP